MIEYITITKQSNNIINLLDLTAMEHLKEGSKKDLLKDFEIEIKNKRITLTKIREYMHSNKEYKLLLKDRKIIK